MYQSILYIIGKRISVGLTTPTPTIFHFLGVGQIETKIFDLRWGVVINLNPNPGRLLTRGVVCFRQVDKSI